MGGYIRRLTKSFEEEPGMEDSTQDRLHRGRRSNRFHHNILRHTIRVSSRGATLEKKKRKERNGEWQGRSRGIQNKIKKRRKETKQKRKRARRGWERTEEMRRGG